jgi:glycosyltransferase involved in cell wall biosynthesis
MRPLLITTEPAGVRHGSGTAVAVDGLVAALALNGIHVSVARGGAHPLGHTVARWRDRRPTRLTPRAYDVVLGVNGDGLATARAASLPMIALPKALYAAVEPYERGLTRWLIRRHASWEAAGCRGATLVIAPSSSAAAFVARRYDVPWARIVVIGEPFGAEAWRRSLPPVAREGRRVLTVAHLYPRKRVSDLLDAWPGVLRRHPGAVLDVVGDGPALAGLRRRAEPLRGVTVHGHVEGDALRRLYAAADVFVSTSAHETFGYAVVEALGSGLPVVVGAAPAILELTAAAECRCIGGGDVEGLAVAVVESLTPAAALAAVERNPPIAAQFETATIGAAYASVLGDVAG